MSRAGLAGPVSLVTSQAGSVKQWMSLKRLAHAGVFLFDVSSEQAIFPKHQRE